MRQRHSIRNIKQLQPRGFTLVEVMVVVAIIGILLSIAAIAYNGWRQTAAKNSISIDLTNARTSMESVRNYSATYPASIPTSFKPSKGVTVTLMSSSASDYCIEATSTDLPGVVFNMKHSTNVVDQAAC